MPFQLPEEWVESMAAFLLVFFRMTGLMLAAPLLSSETVPNALRVWFSFCLAAICFPIVNGLFEDGFFTMMFRTPALTTMVVVTELAVGWVIGWVGSIMIWAAQFGGHIAGQEVGLAIGEVFDPVSQSSSSPLASLFMTVGVVVFVLLDGHTLLISAIIRSFEVVPPASLLGIKPEASLFVVQELGGQIWKFGLVMGLPLIGALLLATVSMALLAKIVPEMNIFMIGFSIRIGLGLMAVAYGSTYFVQFLVGLASEGEGFLEALFRVLSFISVSCVGMGGFYA